MKQIKFSKLELIDLSIIAMTLIQALPLLKGFSSIENTDFLLKGLNLLGLLILSIYIVAKKYNKWIIGVFVLIAGILTYAYLNSGMSTLLSAWVLLFATYQYDYRKILKDIRIALIIVVLISLLIFISNSSDISMQLSTGLSLGFVQKNVLGYFLFTIYTISFYLAPPKFPMMTSLGLSSILLFLVKSKTGASLILIFPVVIYFYRYITVKNLKIFELITQLLVPIYIIFTYQSAKIFPTSNLAQNLNNILTNRIFLNWFIFDKNKLTLFGQNIQLNYTGVHNEIINGWNIVTTVDGSYTILLLVLGIIPTIVYIIGSMALVKKAFRQKDYIFLAVFFLIANYSFSETVFTNISFNYVFFYLFSRVNKIPNTKKLKIVFTK